MIVNERTKTAHFVVNSSFNTFIMNQWLSPWGNCPQSHECVQSQGLGAGEHATGHSQGQTRPNPTLTKYHTMGIVNIREPHHQPQQLRESLWSPTTFHLSKLTSPYEVGRHTG